MSTFLKLLDVIIRCEKCGKGLVEDTIKSEREEGQPPLMCSECWQKAKELK